MEEVLKICDWVRSLLTWDALTAIGTSAMAITTYFVIRQGAKQRQDAERQHRDQFKPICVLTPYNHVDAWNKRGELIAAIPPGQANQAFGTINIFCALKNVGVGPALNLRLKFRFPNRNESGWSTDPWELAPLGAGKEYGSGAAPLAVPFRLIPTFTTTDFSGIEGDLWEIWLEYEDVFGRSFRSIHSKAPVNTDLSIATWTYVAGEQPKAAMPPIPWFAYHEGPVK